MDTETLTADFAGAVAQYGDTLLFVGFDLGDGQLQITVYPGYRFPADDRVHGHIGIFDAQIGSPWATLLEQVDAIEREAVANYERCARFRTSARRARYASRAAEEGVDHIADLFRESWAGFALRLAREGEVRRDDVVFRGDPARAFLAEWQGRPYTIRVYDTGSLLIVPSDRRDEIP